MVRRLTSLFAVLTFIILLPTASLAGVPDPSTSSVQDCLVTCPEGEMDFLVVVRDADGVLCPGVVVEISFCGCSGQQLCAGNADCSDGTSDRLLQTTDASGEALFSMAAGGECDGLVDISADGVFLAQREVKTTDTTGNFIVEADDMVDLSNPANDYNCDGVINLIDLSVFNTHVVEGHSCEAPVGLESGSWGSIKAHWD